MRPSGLVEDAPFYGPEQAAIHHADFGFVAREAAGLLIPLLREAGHATGTVVDLGSGSGIFARIVSEAGYEVLGFDISPAMVELSRREAPGATFVCGSLMDAAIPRAVAVTALGEALNYATDPRAGLAEVELLARRVRDALEPGGVFLFDVSTPGREGPNRSRRQWHDRPNWTLYMETKESEDGTTLDRFITIFSKTNDLAYHRTDEHHVLRLYDPQAIDELLRRSGFDVEVRDGYDAALPSCPAGRCFSRGHADHRKQR